MCIFKRAGERWGKWKSGAAPRFSAFKSRLWYWITSPYRAFRAACYAVGFAVIVTGGVTLVLAIAFWRSLPSFDSLKFNDLRSSAIARVQTRKEGQTEKQRWVSLNEVSRDCIYSIVMSEDSHFFEHEGINFDAVMDSLAENLRERKAAYGASTISQQVVKNLFLQNEKSVIRKLKEWILTERMEKRFTKNEILELYLNIAEFGPDIFGIHDAASHFFQKSPSALNAAEGAFLALMLPSPRRNYYAIVENHNLTKARVKKIDRILRDMYASEYISEKQYRAYRRYDYFSKRRPASQ